jgi:hypothetical protein
LPDVVDAEDIYYYYSKKVYAVAAVDTVRGRSPGPPPSDMRVSLGDPGGLH